MKRSLNVTGRKRILRESILDATLTRSDGKASATVRVEVDASDEALQECRRMLPLPTLVAEVRGSAYSHRIDLGTVAAPTAALVTLPDAHLLPPNPTLRIFAVDRATGRLLARADHIPLGPRGAAAGSPLSLLPASFENLHGLVWRIAADPDDDGQTGPRLVLDERLRELDLNQRLDFVAVVLPEAVRQVVVDWYRFCRDDDLDIVHAWRRKVFALVRRHVPPELAAPDGLSDEEQGRAWRDFAAEVARAFATEMRAIDRFIDDARDEP